MASPLAVPIKHAVIQCLKIREGIPHSVIFALWTVTPCQRTVLLLENSIEALFEFWAPKLEHSAERIRSGCVTFKWQSPTLMLPAAMVGFFALAFAAADGVATGCFIRVRYIGTVL